MPRAQLFAVVVGLMFTVVVTTLVWPSPRPSATSSLRGKTDSELLEFVVRHQDPASRYVSDENDDDRARPSPLDQFWEMDSKEAALAFVTDHVSPHERGKIVFEIDDPNAKPPESGEIGLRWMGGAHYGPYEEGVTILKYDGYNSKLLISKVGVEGQPSKEELEEAVMKTDEHRLYRAVAQQTYEILWWLRHVRFQNKPESYSSATYSSGDNLGRFWMKPDGPTLDQVMIGEPCGQCINANKDPEAYVGFADMLLRRLVRRSGIKDRYPVPQVGKWQPKDEDDQFLHTHITPEPKDEKAVSEYVQRLCAILRNPQSAYLYDAAMERLVPMSDPLRYRDKRIDDALIDLLHRGLEAKAAIKPPPDEHIEENVDVAEIEKQLQAWKAKAEKAREEKQKLNNLWFAGGSAAEKLGMHDASQFFDELVRLSTDKTISSLSAARIAGRHPELRSRLIDCLKADFSLEAVWRADLRELEEQVQQMADSDPRYDLFYTLTPEQEKAHQAALLLATWREPDKLTKTKLDILLTGAIGRGADVPDVLRQEFAELSRGDQMKVRNFVTWMRTVDVPWSRHYIENVFTPHTPRPDVPFEH